MPQPANTDTRPTDVRPSFRPRNLAGAQFRHFVNVRSRRRSCLFTLLSYIAAVLLVQNALMAYNFAVRNRLQAASPSPEKNVSTFSNVVVVKTTSTNPPSPPPHVNEKIVAVTENLQNQKAQNESDQTVGAPTEMSKEEMERRYYRKRPDRVNPYVHHVLLAPSTMCRKDTRMVILVHSHPSNIDRRAAIRETWGFAVRSGSWPNEKRNGSCRQLQLGFVVGLDRNTSVNEAVRKEHAEYDDILQGDFYDSYQNMTLKSLLDLKLVDERCPGVKYFLKSDDDMIINFPYLLEILASKSPTRAIMGPYNPRSRVFRQGVWKLTKEEFPFDFYPPYESGSAYVITGDLIHELFSTAEYVPHIFVDDVYITGILGRILQVKHVRQRGFAFWGTRMPTACDLITKKIITGTKMHPQRLTSLWNDLLLNPSC